jgi:glycosyltransferase involved in cell wall biosynthesis
VSTNQPLVSVIMAAHNHEAFVAEALDSVLAQSYENVEIVAVDDASTDSTPRILEDYARRYPGQVRVSLSEESIGPCRRRNEALAMARGELICWLDSDDIWLPSKVEKQVAVMEARPEVGLVYTAFEAFDSATGATLPWGDTSPRTGDHLVPLFVEGCFIGSLTIMFRRRVLDDRSIGLRDRDRSYGDDYQLHLVAALGWELTGIDEVLARYRRHPGNTSLRAGNDHVKRIALLREFLEEYPEARPRLGRHRRLGLANHYLLASSYERQGGSRARAGLYLLGAAIRDPGRALRAPVRSTAGIVRRGAARIAALAALGVLAILALFARAGTATRRRRGRRPRLVWGPEPLINIKYWSEAMRRLGYESTTLVSEAYSIYSRDDFDLQRDDFLGSGRLAERVRDYRVFAWTLRHADVHLTFFNGGFLRNTPLRGLEARLLRIAGKKLVVSPYGGDIAVPGYLGVTEEALLQDYPYFEDLAEVVKERVDYFARWADVVVRNYQNGYLPRADVTWVTQLAFDASQYPAGVEESAADGRDGEVAVIHAPNHRHVKGTAALIQAVEELREEGLRIRLDLFENRSNTEVRRAIFEADVVVDQLIAGYAMFALEGLAAGKPVMTALSGMPPEVRGVPALRDCPIVEADRATVKRELRRLVVDPELRARLGAAGREFARRYHSLDAVGDGWRVILDHLWRGTPLPDELPAGEPAELDPSPRQQPQPAGA